MLQSGCQNVNTVVSFFYLKSYPIKGNINSSLSSLNIHFMFKFTYIKKTKRMVYEEKISHMMNKPLILFLKKKTTSKYVSMINNEHNRIKLIFIIIKPTSSIKECILSDTSPILAGLGFVLNSYSYFDGQSSEIQKSSTK